MGILEVKDRVQRMLSELIGRIEIDPDGDFTFSFESTRVFVLVRDWEATESVLVTVQAIFLWEVPGSPELFEFVATEAYDYRFGALCLYRREDGNFNANFKHTLIGDTLDPDEFKHALFSVTIAANALDDEMKEKFGGKRWEDF